MTKLTCAREKEVEELVNRGQWPQACADELRAHVEGCRACSDLALVAQAFQAAHTTAIATPVLPSAGFRKRAENGLLFQFFQGAAERSAHGRLRAQALGQVVGCDFGGVGVECGLHYHVA